MASKRYAIEFHLPMQEADHTMYAGKLSDGGLGFAPSITTALVDEDREKMERILVNGYGSLAENGEVVEV